jgi:hypothetical protein
MRDIVIFLAAVTALGGTCVGGPVYAQARIQEENLVYTDPTMALPGRWTVGANAELWGGITPWVRTQDSTQQWKGWQAGGSLSVGYDAFQLQLTGLSGSATGTSSMSNGATVHTHSGITEIEILGRYVFPSAQFWGITPYVLGGYDFVQVPQSDAVFGNFFYPATGSSQRKLTNTFNTLFIGVGGLYEFTQNVGLRFDVEIGPSFGESKYTNFLPSMKSDFSGTQFGFMSHLTVYWRITDDIVAQVGLKAAGIEGGANGVQVWGAAGAFGSIGYAHRF